MSAKINKELLEACKGFVKMVEVITPIPGYPYGMGIINSTYENGVCAINKAVKKKKK